MKNKLLYSPAVTLDEIIRLLDNNGNGFLPVVDKDDKLVGIITDGDLRRAILNKKYDLESIINKKPGVASANESHVDIKRKLREMRRRHMPVVDANGKLIEVVVLDDFEKLVKENWVVIMAGGLGSRLGDLTKDTPKPMLEVGGKPMLRRIMEHFETFGFHKFILCVNYKSEVIENYFGNGEQFGFEIKYTKETKRMGTAGALSLIDFEIDQPFFVVNGDIITSINFEDFLNFHSIKQADATMCVKRFSHEIPYACVEFDENYDLKMLKEKPTLDYFINAGMYVLNPSCLGFLQKNEFFDMPSLFEVLSQNNKSTKVFTISDYWLDIGMKDDYNRARGIV